MKRKAPLRRVGRRKRREQGAEQEFRRAVLERCVVYRARFTDDGEHIPRLYACEVCGRRQFQELDAHHIQPRSRGGSHDPSNGLGCCRRCHGEIHDHSHPDWRKYVH